MLKIAVILLLICLLFRWAIGKWPWQILGGAPSRSQRLKDARELLGVARIATREDILAAHRKTIAEVHPDRGGSNAQVHEANDARDLLLSDLPVPAKPAPRDDADGPSQD